MTTETLEPEKFTNYELGVKWDVLNRLSLAAAAYRLDRTNTTAPDPSDPARTVQTGSQRTKGFEFSVHRRHHAGVADHRRVRQPGRHDHQPDHRGGAGSQGSAGPAEHGLAVEPIPARRRALGLGLGVIYQDEMYAPSTTAVTLPSFTRVDAAAYYGVSRYLRLQVNLENLFDQEYFATAHSNNNITPGSPRSVRVAVVTGF